MVASARLRSPNCGSEQQQQQQRVGTAIAIDGWALT